ncbi:hypothetical protein HY251_04585, partial [bacterium]|nr:hypothetical protein [bacterium]
MAGLSFLLSVGPVAAGDAPALGDVPHVQQKGELGGEACVEMWCRKLGKSISQEDVFDQSGADPALGRGCSADELVVSLKKLGFKAERPEPFESTSPEKTRQVASLKFTSGLKADLDRGVPCVVEMRCEDKPDARTAFRLFLRHDVATDEVVFHDPSRADGASSRLKKDAFLALWPITKGEETRVVRIALEAEKVVEPKRPAGFAPSAYALHVMNRRARLGEDAKGFAIVIEPPFVVLGDEPIERVRSRSAHTVRWAVTKLKQDYFEKDPDEILEVWLLKDKESYERNAKRVFGDTPTTPYGYYSHAHKALIMNIATGGGTLVHEIVHPYVAANFPDCPTWLNEGL